MIRGSFQFSRSFYLAPTIAAVIALLLVAVFLQALERERLAWERAWDARGQLTREVNALFARFTMTHADLFALMARTHAGGARGDIAAPNADPGLGVAWFKRVTRIREDLLALDWQGIRLGEADEDRTVEGLFQRAADALDAYNEKTQRVLGAMALSEAPSQADVTATVEVFQKTHHAFNTLWRHLEESLLASPRAVIAAGERQSLLAAVLILLLVPLMFLLARRSAKAVTGSLARVIDRLRALGREARRDLALGASEALDMAGGEARGPETGFPPMDSSDPFSRLWDSVEAFERVLRELRISRGHLKEQLSELARQTEGRAAAEAAFGASEHRFRTLVDNANVAIYVHRRFRMLYANPALRALVGKGEEETEEAFMSTSTRSFLSPEESTMIESYHQARLAGLPAPRDYEMTLVRRDGSTRLVLNRSFPIHWEGGQAVCTTLVDLTDRRETLDRLRILSAAIEQMPDIVFILDAEGAVEYVNPAFTEVTGYALEEVIGVPPDVVRQSVSVRDSIDGAREAIRAGREWRAEIMARRKDESDFWAFTSISPVREEDGRITHYVVLQQDITARKTAELELRRAKEEADLASRAKSELLANMSHELRTPLNAIIGFSETMFGEFLGPLDDQYKEYAKDIRDSGAHLLALINDILDVSAIEAGHLPLREEEIDLASLLHGVQLLIRTRAEAAGITLTGEPPPPGVALWGDARRIKQILLNLLSNAVKFTEDGGRITLRAVLAESGGIQLIVWDTGIGMNAEGVVTALSPFGQVDGGLSRRYQGSGLGLPLTQGLVERHGGWMDVDSAPGVGTTVTVTFPPERTRRGNGG